MLRALVLSLAILTACACGGDDSGGGTPSKAGPPTKADVVARLHSLAAAMAEGDHDAAMAHIAWPGLKAADMPKMMESDPVTKDGIAKIAAQGKFGPAAEILGADRVAHFAKKAQVDASQCYALATDGAEVVAFDDGTSLRFIRINNLHKLR